MLDFEKKGEPKDKEILIIDIETSNFQNADGKIVEIGIVKLNTNTGERTLLYDKLIKEPALTLGEIENSWIVQNSDLKASEVMDANPLANEFNEIQYLLNDYPEGATAFNNVFDFNFMESRGFVFPKKLQCPMKMLTPLLKLPARNGAGFKWPTVTEAYKQLFPKPDYVEKHRGGSDAMDEAEIVYWLIKMGFFIV